MVTIRPFAGSDEAVVIALWKRADLTRPWNDPAKDIARKRRVQRDLFLVAVEQDTIVGTIVAGYDGHRGWVNYLAVDPSKRRQGIGRALMAAAETGVRALGCPKLAIQVRADNPEALAFYEHLGFTATKSSRWANASNTTTDDELAERRTALRRRPSTRAEDGDGGERVSETSVPTKGYRGTTARHTSPMRRKSPNGPRARTHATPRPHASPPQATGAVPILRAPAPRHASKCPAPTRIDPLAQQPQV